MHSIGIERFQSLYKEDEDFSKAYKVCSNFENHFHSKFSEFTLQSGLLFKVNRLFEPRGLIRDYLI